LEVRALPDDKAAAELGLKAGIAEVEWGRSTCGFAWVFSELAAIAGNAPPQTASSHRNYFHF
jgi:hypothetical protein